MALEGVTVVEMAGIGPGPFAAGLLSDLGATVVRVERPTGGSNLPDGTGSIGVRNRLILRLDAKDVSDREVLDQLIASCDVLLEGFRPGVMERLGLGPVELHRVNSGLIYARISGWGQEGPYRTMAGHDINYIGLAGVLAAVGTDLPTPPLNLVGDYAGGALYAVVGILAGLIARGSTGAGCVVDAAMVDGAAALVDPIRDMVNLGTWIDTRSSNLLDGGAPFYRCYETQDGAYMAVGALEPDFYRAFIEGLGLDEADLPERMDRRNWPELADTFADVFASRPKDAWEDRFDGTDACVTPVLSLRDVDGHPHNRQRAMLVDWEGERVARVAPRMGTDRPASRNDAPVSDTLVELGVAPEAARRVESEGSGFWI